MIIGGPGKDNTIKILIRNASINLIDSLYTTILAQMTYLDITTLLQQPTEESRKNQREFMRRIPRRDQLKRKDLERLLM